MGIISVLSPVSLEILLIWIFYYYSCNFNKCENPYQCYECINNSIYYCWYFITYKKVIFIIIIPTRIKCYEYCLWSASIIWSSNWVVVRFTSCFSTFTNRISIKNLIWQILQKKYLPLCKVKNKFRNAWIILSFYNTK